MTTTVFPCMSGTAAQPPRDEQASAFHNAGRRPAVQRQVSRASTRPRSGSRKLPLSVRSAVRICHCSNSLVASQAATPTPALLLGQQVVSSARDRARGRTAEGAATAASAANWTYLYLGPRETAKRAMAHRDAEALLGQQVRPGPRSSIRSAPCRASARERLAPQERVERPAVGLQGHLDAHEVTDRRQHVDRFGHRIDDRCPARRRPPPAGPPRSAGRGSSRPRSRASRAASGRRPSRRGHW